MWIRFAQADVRDVLSTVRVPTLVLHRVGDTYLRVDHGRYLAERIPQARLVELPGSDHIFFTGDSSAILGEIEEFVTGARANPTIDRVLATVLFTDIVGSTDRAARGGDRAWRDLLGRHEDAVRVELDRFRGREIKMTGDGFVATFDGPGRGIRCAVAIRDAVRELGLELRLGLHTGEIELRGDDIAGMAVHIGQRTEATAEPGEIRVSSTVKDLVAGSDIRFSDLGPQRLKGVPDEWRLFAVSSA
jgi:class 3 adenylate cyclase